MYQYVYTNCNLVEILLAFSPMHMAALELRKCTNFVPCLSCLQPRLTRLRIA